MAMDFKFTGYNTKLKTLARELRKQMTPQEKRLWYDFLKTIPYSFTVIELLTNILLTYIVPKLNW